MPIDREQTLKRAERLLRQGRLEAAIAEYGHVVAEFPRDWATANLLGDLYVRAGDTRRAVLQYSRVADHLAADGFVAKAAALYKKILKLEPADEAALLRSVDLAAAQGLVADLRTYLNTLFQRRLKRGDRDGARALAAKRVSFDAADVVARLDAARMLAEAGDAPGAAGELRVAGLTLENQGRIPEAVRALRESLRFDAAHDETRHLLVRLLVAQGDPNGAAEVAATPEQRRALVADLTDRGHHGAARGVLERIVEANPGDGEARMDLARRCLAAGDLVRAEACLAGADAGSPAVGVALAELAFRRGRADEGTARVSDLLARRWEDAPEVAGLAARLAVDDVDAAAGVISAVASAAADRREFAWARGRLREFLAKAPGSVVAWRCLIDVCIDAGFEADLPDAQSHLADALIGHERWQEAMAVAEDLLASHPDDGAHVERLRRVLVGLGRDPGPALARLRRKARGSGTDQPDLAPSATLGGPAAMGGDSLLSDDFSDLVAALSAPPASAPLDVSDLGAVVPPLQPPAASGSAGEAAGEELLRGPSPIRPRGLNLFDESLRRLFEEPPGPHGDEAARVAFEVDLSGALEDLRASEEAYAEPAGSELRIPARPEPASTPPADLEGFFSGLRAEAVVDTRTLDAQRLFDEGQASYAGGEPARAIAQLRAAARDPVLRLRAARLIAQIAKDQGNLTEAIEWLERAAEAPAPSLDTWQGLLFELADTLQQAGESARALAVLLELRAATPGYGDVDQRIAALSGEPAPESGDPPGRAS